MASPVKRPKGWFVIPGVQAGDRTLEDQRRGLEAAIAEVQNARAAGTPLSVLDLGCAEGLLGREFVLAGADQVVGVELVREHVIVACQVCKDVMPPLELVHSGIAEFAIVEQKREPFRRFDLVLALSVCHKLRDPSVGLRYAARAARRLLCFRNAARFAGGGSVQAKHGTASADAWQIFAREGLVLERRERSSRGEAVEYWRRPA